MITVNCKNQELVFNNKIYRCAIGKNGFTNNKQEGDNMTPLGQFKLVELWYRADKINKPKTGLPIKIISKNDGWCDDINSDDYNLHINLPSDYSHENLYRNDNLYNLIVVLDYNYKPSIKGNGSAIFMHVAKERYTGTEGCIALAENDLLEILENCNTNTNINVLS